MSSSLSKLVLGTAQWGLDYGISNEYGRTKKSEIKALIDLASDSGCHFLDTASAYGDSEKIIGQLNSKSLKIISKINNFGRKKKLGKSDIFEQSKESLRRLKKERLYGLLLHNSNELLSLEAKSVYFELEKVKKCGLAEKIGVSAYDISDILKIIEVFPIDIIQVPYNVLDKDRLNAKVLEKIKSKGIEVHVRSVFLQGLLLMDSDNLPSKLSCFRPYIKKICEGAYENQVTTAQYLLRYALQNSLIDKVVLGVASVDQLKEQIVPERLIDYSSISSLRFHRPCLLDPRSW